MKELSSVLFLICSSAICFSQAYQSESEKKMINRFNTYNSEKLPDHQMMDVHGTAKRLSDYKSKVKLLDFWATWCGNCVKDIPAQEEAYQRLKKRYGDDFEWINISVDSDTLAWKDLIRSKGKAGVNLIGQIDTIQSSYYVKGYPTFILINENNEVIGHDVAQLDWGGSQMLEYLIFKGMDGMASGEVFDSLLIALPDKNYNDVSPEYREWMNSYDKDEN